MGFKKLFDYVVDGEVDVVVGFVLVMLLNILGLCLCWWWFYV